MASPDWSGFLKRSTNSNEARVLWIAPNLNHYRIPLLNKLAEEPGLELSVLAGKELKNLGHKLGNREEKYTKYSVNASKSFFQIHPAVYFRMLRLLWAGDFNVVLMPMEKKLVLLIIYFFILKFIFRFKLVSYNHQATRGSSFGPQFDFWLTKSLFKLYDKIIFYTRDAKSWALRNSLLRPDKAYVANNTIDTEEIFQQKAFKVNSSEKKVILFIGRLVAYKRLDLLLEYYSKIRSLLPGVTLNVIGDGPDAETIAKAARNCDFITWQGVLVEENEIAEHMESSHLVFIPGHSGLSIVHAFCYGKPYATINSDDQPPEVAYLINNENGLMLTGDMDQDCLRIVALLSDQQLYEETCRAAYTMGRELSKENWSMQMTRALKAV